MEVKRSRNHEVFPYVILAVVTVCAVLIVYQLWTNIGSPSILPQGPTATATLWWRTPQAATPAALSANPTPAVTPTPSPRRRDG